jgi:hypothetical protein
MGISLLPHTSSITSSDQPDTYMPVQAAADGSCSQR